METGHPKTWRGNFKPLTTPAHSDESRAKTGQADETGNSFQDVRIATGRAVDESSLFTLNVMAV